MKKEKTLLIRLSENEWNLLNEKSKRTQRSKSSLVRSAIKNQKIFIIENEDEIKKFSYELTRGMNFLKHMKKKYEMEVDNGLNIEIQRGLETLAELTYQLTKVILSAKLGELKLDSTTATTIKHEPKCPFCNSEFKQYHEVTDGVEYNLYICTNNSCLAIFLNNNGKPLLKHCPNCNEIMDIGLDKNKDFIYRCNKSNCRTTLSLNDFLKEKGNRND